MAEFLTRTGISDRLEGIIKNAQERLYLVSPYLQINQLLRERIEEKVYRSKIDIRVIYREINPKQLGEKEWLESMTSIKTSVRKNLHAKCYLNEKEALLTSMNLYQFSQEHNDEMGILVSVDHDRELYNKISEDVWRIIRVSEETPVRAARVNPAENVRKNARAEKTPREPQRTPREPQQSRKPGPLREALSALAALSARSTLSAPKKGFCIRCKADLPAKPIRPYCNRCYAIWNRYQDEDFEERYCHTCGNGYPSTMLKPLCFPCFGKYKDVLEFAVS